ncbi:hypothetical protein EHS25_009173 [Saitozyma podzolica]|uniref:DUF6534 domain-containing protein n=1 Tax=Saitozyma podzolica TaxID=1890683 RepID=A0A427YL28_9TREE|nr:hypothetical protein EHS25_009173 [Saitozyma podzolica]
MSSAASTNATAMAEAVEAQAQELLGGNPGFWLGPELIGTFVDAIFCGVMIMQFAQWVSFSRNDRNYTKMVVYGSFTASIGGTVYSIWYAMHLFVYGFGVWANFLSTSYTAYFLIPDFLTAVLVQGFFAERAYRLTGNSKFFLAVAILLMIFCFGSSVALLVSFNVLSSATQIPSLRAVAYTWISAQLATDLTMTGTIMYGLIKSRTGWSETDKLVKRLVALSMETQLPPTLLAFGLMITYTVDPTTLIDIFFIMVLSKAYICGLLGALNSRYHLRRDADGRGSENTFKGARSGRPTQATVHVATETYTEAHRIPEARVGINRSRFDENVYDEGKDNYELSDVDEHSARQLDYTNNDSRTGLTAV